MAEDKEEKETLKENTEKTEAKEKETAEETKEPGGSEETGKTGKHTAAGIIAAAVIIILGVIYIAGALSYSKKFFPGTFVNGKDVSGMSLETASKEINFAGPNYKLIVYGRDKTGESAKLGEVDGDDISFRYIDTGITLMQILDRQNIWAWPIEVITAKHKELKCEPRSVYDPAALASVILSWDVFDPSNMENPKAPVIRESESCVFEVVEGEKGNLINTGKLKDALTADGLLGNAPIEINIEDFGLYEGKDFAAVQNELTKKADRLNKMMSTNMTYKWDGQEIVIDQPLITEWVDPEGAADAELDEEAVKEFVKNTAWTYDTFGRPHKFVTALGYPITINSLTYGWKTDVEATAAQLIAQIKSGETGLHTPVYEKEAFNDGEDDIGNTYIEADLTNQHIYLFEDGVITLESDLVSGNVSTGRATPDGLFSIANKVTKVVLRGSDFETPVDYWMGIYPAKEIGIHDAWWRAEFGGDIYLLAGSHGCINLPPAFVAQLYDRAKVGMPVFVYYLTPLPALTPEQISQGYDPEAAIRGGGQETDDN